MTLLRELLESQTNLFQDLCNDFAFFLSLNAAGMAQYATDQSAKTEISAMQKQFRSPAVNGKQFADVIGDSVLMSDPKARAAILRWIYTMLQYIEPRLNRFLTDEGKNKYLPRFEQIKSKYTDLVNRQ